MKRLLIVCMLLACMPAWADKVDVERQLDTFDKLSLTAESGKRSSLTAAANQLMQAFLEAEVTDEAVRFSDNTPADSLRKQVWYWAAEYFYAEQDYKQSVAYGEKALPLTRGTDMEADCLSILSLALFRQADYEASARYAKECYRLDELTGDPDVMSSSLNTLAGIYLGANQPREAEQYILKAIEQASKVDNPARMAVLQGMASEVYHQMGDDQRALPYARRACEIEEQCGDAYRLAVRRAQLASVMIGRHDYAEAEQTLGEAIPVFRQVGDRHSLGIALNKLGMALLCQQRQPEAIAHYREAESIFEEMGDLANEMHAQRGLYESYWTLNPDSAKLALDRFDLLKDSLYSNATAESLARFNAEFGTDWLHRENEQLHSRVRTYIFIGIGLWIAITVCLLWLRRRMKIREAALRATIAELQRQQRAEAQELEATSDAANASTSDAANVSSSDAASATTDATAIAEDDLSAADRELLSRLVLLVRRDMSQADISVEALASELCITRGQLNRRMKAITGLTTQQYITRVRMEQARLMLTSHPELPIAEVAFRCGFADPTSFTRAFRQTFGIAPSQFKIK